MTPDHVRGGLSSDAGATSSSISWPIVPSPIPTLSNAPSLTLSPISTTSDNQNHRPFAGGGGGDSLHERGQLSPLAPTHQASFAPRPGPNLTIPKPDKSVREIASHFPGCTTQLVKIRFGADRVGLIQIGTLSQCHSASLGSISRDSGEGKGRRAKSERTIWGRRVRERRSSHD